LTFLAKIMYIITIHLIRSFSMKKILALSLFAMAALVSQAWATCEIGTNGTTSCCRWDNDPTNCWGIGGTYDDTKTDAACESNYGQVVTDCNATLKTALGCCNWETEGSNCWTIFSGVDPQDGKEGSEKVTQCSGGSNRYWASIACPTSPSGACPTTPPTYDGKNPAEGFCCWEANEYNDYIGYCGPIAGETTIAKCETDGGSVVSSCGGCRTEGTPPVSTKFTPASAALIVAPFGRSLHISSAKDAMVSLYDMNGAKVYSGKVSAGNRVFSLERVASGSYYAIVQSGSNSKKVPVILK
jgi:hypothetical protein